jgi:hypothetical protein
MQPPAPYTLDPYANAPDNPYRPPPPPPPPPPKVSVIEAFKFVFAAEGWFTTALIATLFAFIPLVGPIAMAGYHADMIQRLARREPARKLSFNDFTALLTRGVPSFFTQLVVTFTAGAASMFVVFPAFIAVSQLVAEEYMGLAMVSIMLSAFAIGFIAFAPLLNAAITYAALGEDLAASLRPKPVLAYARRTWGTVLGAYLVLGILGACLMFVGFLAFFIGIYVTVGIIQLALAHLRWQIYESQLARGGALIPIKVPAALPGHAYAYAQGYGQPVPTNRENPPR